MKPHKFRLTLNSLKATKINGDGGHAELYGWAESSAAYYDENGKETGGNFGTKDIWRYDKKNNNDNIQLKAGQSKAINQYRDFVFAPELVDQACIKIRGQLFDYDFWNSDENYGIQEMKICIKDDHLQWEEGDGHFDLDTFSAKGGEMTALLRFYLKPIE